ncbi:MAG: ABC transporter ATP-binding protein [Armatimonadetes bacterium]|nr:ABC transporter ATP-binding protein [Armatimonadota bacterium]
MEQTGVWGLRDRAITQISGGELQRVVISQALAQESRVLLLDEPTSHLDIAHQVEVMALLEALKNEKHLTILLSIHDLNLASLYCDALILLKGGRIHALGRPDQVVHAENIREVYSADVEADLDGTTGRPRVFLKKK